MFASLLYQDQVRAVVFIQNLRSARTATVLDSVTGCAVHSTLEAGVGYGTIDLQVKMLRPVPRNQALMAEATTVHVSRNIATSEGTLKSSDGKLLATATATCFLKRG